MSNEKIKEFFNSLQDKEIKSYTKYWTTIAPKSYQEYMQRWLFAYTSIHTTWRSNVRGYNAIKEIKKWEDDKALLTEKLKKSGVGLHNGRSKGIWEFKKLFITNASSMQRKPWESWVTWRNRLVESLYGIGFAKVSFALEMSYPTEANITCLDVHMLKLYGLAQTKSQDPALYTEVEHDWVTRSRKRNVAPYIARCLYWDKKQKQKDSRYWSYVFE